MVLLAILICNEVKSSHGQTNLMPKDRFQKMKIKFIDNGYPVILGEYSVFAHLNLGSSALNAEYEVSLTLILCPIKWMILENKRNMSLLKKRRFYEELM
jgi:hypothetical protein